MGRKNRRRNRRPASTGVNNDIDPVLWSGTEMRQSRRVVNHQYTREALTKMDELDRLPFEGQRDAIRERLIYMGTDCDRNDSDPTGDGDQSKIATDAQRQAARDLYAIGGDINAHAANGSFEKFAFACIVGSMKAVQKDLDDMTERIAMPWSRHGEMKKMLETRETSMRLSPLLLIVSVGKNISLPQAMATNESTNHVEVAKLLLKYGANPAARDVLGKTACHYGAGAMATAMTMRVVDLCIHAAKSHHLYGKDATLSGLKTMEMNGLEGVVGGFDPDSGRRSFYIASSDREVWVKPENIHLLATPEMTDDHVVALTDVQDRMGSVSLHEAVMQDRVDVASFLLKTHQTSIHTEDMDGMSPLKMSVGNAGFLSNGVTKLVNDAARREGNQNRKARKDDMSSKLSSCAHCQKDLGDMGGKQCAACQSVSYCGRECQAADWKRRHKFECKHVSALKNGIKINRPADMASATVFSASSTLTMKHSAEGYQKPRGVDANEKFVVKVQGGGPQMPILVYDQSRTCSFDIQPDSSGFNEVRAEINKEQTWGGRKTFMKACFDDRGDFIIYPATAGVKTKYNW